MSKSMLEKVVLDNMQVSSYSLQLMDIFAQHPHWPQVLLLAQELKSHGYQAWLAGGCVRDALLGKLAQDFDVVTDARPETIEKLFPGSLSVGKQFGVILVTIDGVQFEVATFRKDGVYEDGRRPKDVVFCTPEEDAQRRDFTVNALFYDIDSKKIHDFVNGVEDLKARKLRAVGNPTERFSEDNLRLLRGLRFIAQLGFEFEDETKKAIEELRESVHVVSFERIRQEILKLFMGQHIQGLYWFSELGYLNELFKVDLAKQGASDAWSITKWSIFKFNGLNSNFNTSESLLWSIFLCDLPSQTPSVPARIKDVELLLKKFKVPRETIEQSKKMLQVIWNWEELKKQRPGILIREFSKPFAEALFWWIKLRVDIGVLATDIVELGQRIHTSLGFDWQLPPSLLHGEDLKVLGVLPGPQMGQILEEIQLLQIEKVLNSKQEAIEYIKKLKTS
jgi:tRNA nucleotidyltransferase/poly(A) polymerase